MNRPPLPPFTAEPAAQKARMAEDAWKTRDRARVALAYHRRVVCAIIMHLYFPYEEMFS